MRIMKFVGVFVLVIAHAWCDIYMHSPRGSNNRLAEKSANRNNANRVFDSQVALCFSFYLAFIFLDMTKSQCILKSRSLIVVPSFVFIQLGSHGFFRHRKIIPFKKKFICLHL